LKRPEAEAQQGKPTSIANSWGQKAGGLSNETRIFAAVVANARLPPLRVSVYVQRLLIDPLKVRAENACRWGGLGPIS
jgi:hypothetical protein